MDIWSGGDGEGGGVNEDRRVPTLKWPWHSKIMKNDDEAKSGSRRRAVCLAEPRLKKVKPLV